MNNRRGVSIILAILLIYLLCGCQLATEAETQMQGDKLVGVFITSEHLNLFDMESYLKDNLSSLPKNGGVLDETDSSKYNGRIYATLESEELTSESGKETNFWQYEFKNLEGIPFFITEIKQPDGETYESSSSSGFINDAHISVGNGTKLEGTIYLAPNGNTSFYTNPVYQSGDGSVYLVAGTGISSSGGNQEGTSFTQTLDEKYTVQVDGEKKEESMSVKITASIKNPVSKITMYQMNQNSEILFRSEFDLSNYPETMTLAQETAYVVVESKSDSAEGNTITRSLLTSDDDHFTVYRLRENGFFEADMIRLQWEVSLESH